MYTPRKNYLWKAGSFDIELGIRTRLMGIVNVTPDSFSGDGALRSRSRDRIPGLSHALRLIDQGADIIDIGGESTRPGADRVRISDEISRVIPLIKALAHRTQTPISIDSHKASVVKQALDAGAVIVNLIKGTPPPAEILSLVKDHGAGLVLMHMRGTPKTMQRLTSYHDVIRDIRSDLTLALRSCLAANIPRTAIVIDPGIGFAKSLSQNLRILKELSQLNKLRYPVLLGTSRKSFITKTLGNDDNSRIMGTAASVCISICAGAHIVRVHDVHQMRSVADMADAILNPSADMVPA